jgi:hypothetical protein
MDKGIEEGVARQAQANAGLMRQAADAKTMNQAELQAGAMRAQQRREAEAAYMKAREAEENRIAEKRAAALGPKKAGRALEGNNSSTRRVHSAMKSGPGLNGREGPRALGLSTS